MKATKKSLLEATRYQFNEVREWNGLKIARVCFHSNRAWKLVDTLDFNVAVATPFNAPNQFNTLEDLWLSIKK